MGNEITIPTEYAKSILKVLDNQVSMGFAIVSQEIKEIVSKEAYDKLCDILYKYHNANCGPFNRLLENKIKEAETPKETNTRI